MGNRAIENSRYVSKSTLTLADHERQAYIASLAEGFSSRLQAERVFSWLYEQNVYGESHHVLALHKEKVVGRRSFWRNDVIPGHLSYQPIDTYVCPEMRRQGIFSHMTRLALQNAKGAYIYNYPNATSRSGYLKMGWSVRQEERMDVHIGFADRVWAACRYSQPIPADVFQWRFVSCPIPRYCIATRSGQTMVIRPKRIGPFTVYLALGSVDGKGNCPLKNVSPTVLAAYYGGTGLVRVKKNPRPIVENSLWKSFEGTIPCWKPDWV